MNKPDHFEELKKALTGINKLKAKIVALEANSNEPIAIIGMSCRFPQAPNTEAFWQMLQQGKSVITPIPASRWDNEHYYSLDASASNKYVCPYGGFIDDVDRFDASFFNIAPSEAALMDPQQRIVLEEAWHAFEDAGLSMEQLKSSLCGVYIGLMNIDYQELLIKNNNDNRVGHELMGSAGSILAARISYFFDLRGPNMVIDTACSSSLVALHEACQSLRHGESEIALAGGITLHLSPERYVLMSKAGMLSPDGKCKTFSNDANGFVPGEGMGLVVLKPLSKALQDNDIIHAVIKGSIVNQDGKTNGITVPNALAQTDLELALYQKFKLDPGEVSYVEAHGTGTKIGDPIEVEALTSSFARYTDKKNYCAIGSVKSNIGHTIAAAGIAGVMKVALTLQHKTLVPTLHVTKLNEYIDFQNSPFYVNQECKAWEPINEKRIACLSSFGFSGTNVHFILEEAPVPKEREKSIKLPEAYLFVLSAKTRHSLEQLVAAYCHYLANTKSSLGDICYTAALGRNHFNHRIALQVCSKEELLAQLQSSNLTYHETPIIDEVVASDDLAVLNSAYLAGKNIDWAAYYAPYAGVMRKVIIPSYCFDSSRYWIDIKRKKALYYGASLHDLLGARLPGYGDDIRFLNQLDMEELEYLKSHMLFDEVIVPGSGLIESVLAADRSLKGGLPVALSDMSLLKPLQLLSGRPYDYQINLKPVDGGYEGRIDAHLQEGTGWDNYATFRLALTTPVQHRVVDIESMKAGKAVRDISQVYADFARLNVHYGAEFQVMREAYFSERSALVLVALQEGISSIGYCMHPTLLDGVFQAVALLGHEKSIYIPSMIESLVCYQPLGQRVWAQIQLQEEDERALKADATLYDEQGVVVGEIKGFRARVVDKRSLRQLLSHNKMADVYVEELETYRLPQHTPSTAPVLVFTDNKVELPANWQQSQGVDVDWSASHVIVVYAGDFSTLIALAQRALKEPPLSITLLVHNAFRTNDSLVDATQRAAVGFWRTFSQEAGNLSCHLIDSDTLRASEKAVHLINQNALAEPELIMRGQEVYVPRLNHEIEALSRVQKLPVPQKQHYLDSGLGIDTLYWSWRDLSDVKSNQLRIRIEATALNFRDVLNAMQLYPGDAGDLGYECVGRVLAVGSNVNLVQPGDRVAVLGQGLFAGEAIVNEVQVCLLPEQVTSVEGAAIPIVFLTANYGLNHLAKIKRGQKVLIHAASGGVGMAAITLAQLAGAEIYATASVGKQDYLRKTYGLKYVYDSRNADFGQQILADTKGKGVDVILNSLTSEGFIESSLSCLKQGGVFLEIGKLNIYSPEQMDAVRPDVSYHIIAIDTRMITEPEVVQKELQDIFRLFSQGILKSLPIKEFVVNDVKAAFHYLQQAKHLGKVVVTNPTPFEYREDGSYLITGGTGGLGLALAQHLIEQGVRHLIVTSRRKTSDSFQTWINKQLAAGIDVTYYQADVADESAMAKVFKAIASSGYPLKGIFHTAGVVHDGMLINLKPEDFTAVFAAKILGTQYLDQLSREESLDCFVLFSSIASMLGNPGQSNYAMANAFMDGLATARVQQGFPALSINWGPFAAVGMAAHLAAKYQAQGMVPLEAESAFQLMDNLLTSTPAEVGVMHIDWEKALQRSSPYLSHLVAVPAAPDGEWISLLAATPKDKREQVLYSKIKNVVAQILTIQDANQMEHTRGFFEMGMDSLMAVDLKNKLQQQLGDAVHLTNTAAFDHPSVKAMGDYLLEQMHFKDTEERSVEPIVAIASDESIAIIGLSGEFPGAKNVAQFWQMLCEGREGISEIPKSRWDIDTYYDANPNAPGKMNTRRGGFIEDIEQFDSAFFAISPKEATYLDPQQRLLLTHTWLALENAGIAPSGLAGSDTGVFVGIATHDYSDLINRYQNPEAINAYIGTGNALSTASGRISYTLGLEGPNLAIDTACSSSLVALNEACERIQRGECRMAIVGGVNALLTPEMFINFSKAGMLSPDGKCKTFDETANGYVRGEGCGVVIVKRLSDALADNDPILAVIKASAINQDGASSGLTVPNGSAQERLLRHVLSKANVAANDIDYIECHGTGTSLGDPIEVHAIGQVYGTNRVNPLYLGSVKTNIGHLEAAAGIAGLIKTVLALNEEQLLAHLNFQQLNPHIQMTFPAEVITQSKPWLKDGALRRAGLSSFGFSGTNAHVILEEAPPPKTRDETIQLPDSYVFVLSAKSKQSLVKMIANYSDYLTSTDDLLSDICYTAAVGRSHFNYRLALRVNNKGELLHRLRNPDLLVDKTVFQEVLVSDEIISDRDPNVLMAAYLKGKCSDWAAYYAPYQPALRKIHLPTYYFDRQRYWIDINKTKKQTHGKEIHPLLGSKVPSHSTEVHFINSLDLCELEYLKDHTICGHVLFPGAGFVESALAAGIELFRQQPFSLGELLLLAPLELKKKAHYEVSLVPASDGGYLGAVYVGTDEESSWNHHVDFKLNRLPEPVYQVIDLGALKETIPKMDISELYSQFARMGLQYGKAFRTVKEVFWQKDRCLVGIGNEMDSKAYCMHPALLDGIFQAIALLINESNKQELFLPANIHTMEWYQQATGMIWADIVLVHQDAQSITADMKLYDESGLLLAQISGFMARAIERSALEHLLAPEKTFDQYLESFESYDLPTQTVNDCEANALVVAANGEEQLDERHIMFFYDGDFTALVTLAQRVQKSKALSFTLITQRAFCLNEHDTIQPSHTQALGFWRTLRHELGMPCYLIDTLDKSNISQLTGLICQGQLTEHVVIVRERLFVPRLVSAKTYAETHKLLVPPATSMYLESGMGVDTLYWAKREAQLMADDDVLVRIMATALNFRDVLKAMNLYPGNAGDFGYECAGEVVSVGTQVSSVKPGDKVIVMGQGLFGGEVLVKEIQVYLLPQTLTVEQGASLPIVYITANYALNELAQMKQGQSVLIHAATGGVGLAAIAFAKLKGVTIYATTSAAKQHYLKEYCGIEHVYDSRSTDFGAQILADTKGRGVDLVLNSLTSEGFIEASLSCLKEGGVFLEIGKLNIYTDTKMNQVRPDVHYHIIAIDNRMEEEPEQIHKEFDSILALFHENKLSPLPITSFPVTKSIEAFHYLQHAQQIGKVVVTNPKPFAYRSDAVYLITGGTGGLGHELAKHLLAQGVNHLALTSRHPPSEAIKQWMLEQQEQGIHIIHYQTDVADKKALQEVFTDIATRGHPLKGIFHVAGLLKDGRLGQLQQEDFDDVLAPKVSGSMHLHELSASHDLDCFVLFSSIAAVLGNLGQSNYAAANAFMDGLAILRRHQGLPALSVNWGPFAAVGMAAHLEGQHRAKGMVPLNVKQAFMFMDTQLNGTYTNMTLLQIDWAKNTDENNSYLQHLVVSPVTNQGEWLMLLEATPVKQQEQVLTGKVKALLAVVMNISDPNTIASENSVFNFGMDSLMAVELKNRIQALVGSAMQLPQTLIFDYPTVSQLVSFLLTQISTASGSTNNVIEMEEIDLMDEADLDALLNQELKGEQSNG